jgi:anti-sigma B factor antagonist
MDATVKVMQPIGILDGIHGNQLRREVMDVIANGTKHILIDCAAVTFMDSSGLGALVMMMRAAKQVNGKFAICAVNDQVKVLLELTSMHKVLTIVPDQATFLAELLVKP